MAEFDPSDWQSNKTLAETNEYMWTNKIDCDVTFLVGEGEEKVDKYNLTLSWTQKIMGPRHYLRDRSALAVNCCVIIHCLEASCKTDQIMSAKPRVIYLLTTD